MPDTLNRFQDSDSQELAPGERRAHRGRRTEPVAVVPTPLADEALPATTEPLERRARGARAEERSEADTTEIARSRLPAVNGLLQESNQPIPCLEISEGFERGKLFPIKLGLSVIGRSQMCDIRLNGHGVSRSHLQLERDSYARIHVEDLGSTNGSLINNRPLTHHRLVEGDFLQIGPDTVLLFSFMLERQFEMQQQKYDQLTRDHLTGVYGRQFFDECLRYELDASARYGEPLALMLIDIDHFKQINDSYGHPAGDEVIRKLASTISTNLRGEDLFARIGGEEFAVIARGLSPRETVELGERIRHLVETTPFAWETNVFTCTVSVGITCYEDGDDGTRMLKRADANLYRAKCSGRNRSIGG